MYEALTLQYQDLRQQSDQHESDLREAFRLQEERKSKDIYDLTVQLGGLREENT
jgi:hypothetical protein